MNRPEISVVVCTYNRAALLPRTLESLFAQKPENSAFEILVIDNNSSDDTRAVVASLQTKSPVPLRYIHEPRQGNAYARNTGVEQAHAPIVAFLDDDVFAGENWIYTIRSAFDRDPQICFIGGRVLPLWETNPPRWLTPAHWAPLALLDYGDDEKQIAGQMPLGLLTANIAFRKEVFDKVGRFSPSLQRVKGGIGSMEDTEFLMRVCRSGKTGCYLPQLITWGSIDPGRLTKAYHRRWHTGHGHFYAVMKDPEWERSSFRLSGVPGHLYRETARQAAMWCSRLLSGNTDAAFESECRLRFFYGFFLERRKRSSGGC
jgi:glycosyltransferase involved in cell wall biosynthesis